MSKTDNHTAHSNLSRLTVSTLKQKHPSLYAQCVSLGVQRERERILATLPTTCSSPSDRFALDCIRNGSELTETAKANYLVLMMKAARRDNASAQTLAAIEKRLGVSNDF